MQISALFASLLAPEILTYVQYAPDSGAYYFRGDSSTLQPLHL